LRRTKYLSTTEFSFGSIKENKNITSVEQTLLTSFEIPASQPEQGYAANIIEGWFYAPIENDYLFML